LRLPTRLCQPRLSLFEGWQKSGFAVGVGCPVVQSLPVTALLRRARGRDSGCGAQSFCCICCWGWIPVAFGTPNAPHRAVLRQAFENIRTVMLPAAQSPSGWIYMCSAAFTLWLLSLLSRLGRTRSFTSRHFRISSKMISPFHRCL